MLNDLLPFLAATSTQPLSNEIECSKYSLKIFFCPVQREGFPTGLPSSSKALSWILAKNDIATAAEDTDVALTYPPLHINVAVPGANPADFVEKTLEPGRVVILVSRVSKWEPVDIKLPGRRQADTFHYRPHGVEQRFAVTVHKIQGQICNKIILQLNKRSFMPHLTFSMLYVALSRVRTSESIRFMPPHPTGPGLGYLQTLKPTEDLLTWLEGFDPDDGTGSAWNIARAKEAQPGSSSFQQPETPNVSASFHFMLFSYSTMHSTNMAAKVAATTSTESPIAKPVSTPRRTPNKRKRTSGNVLKRCPYSAA
ncbi:hypothetical protein GHT06_005559 [Daphnia sinensis]|uniref:UvrD-like helicase C-terminal domain-containing protein n=1 Tax=Daphnia sinensis TaxID=1820382 RepID=A0AAD5KW36_9CRUS|nr:hypothetical protein GHT06_005559 [Daphnia sinensis]